MDHRLITVALPAALLLAGALPAQELRRGIDAADVVVVGRQLGKKKHSPDVELHRIEVVHAVRGSDGGVVIVLDWPRLGLHERPIPRQSRLYCLQDASAIARRLGLATEQGPYFRMIGWPGSNPPIGADPARDPIVGFAAVLARATAGASADATAAELAELAVAGVPVVRTEATRALTERPDLRGRIGAAHWSRIVARASGETEDVPYKVALAELCCEQRLAGLVDTLAVSLGPVSDPEFARAVGRIARSLHGEDATAVLERRLVHLRDAKDRAAVLLAIGATNTDSALRYLLQLDQLTGAEAVTAALQEHRAPAAREAALRRGRPQRD